MSVTGPNGAAGSFTHAEPGANAADPRRVLTVAVPVLLIGLVATNDGGLDLPARQQTSTLIWWVLALALAFGFAPRSRPAAGWKLAAAGFLLLGTAQLVSVAWGASDDRALADACRTYGYLGIVALGWAWLGPRSWKWAAAGVFAAAAGVTVYALLGRLLPDLPGIGPTLEGGRLAEPLGYWNALAAWAGMTAAMGLALSAGARRGHWRAIGAATMPVAGTVVYLTYSRGGLGATAAGIAIVVALSPDRARAGANAVVGALATGFCILAIRGHAEIANGTGDGGAFTVGLCVAIAAAACWFWGQGAGARRKRPGRDRPPLRADVAIPLAAVLGIVLVGLALFGARGLGHGGDSALYEDADPSARLTTAAGDRSAYWSEALDAFTTQPIRGEGAGGFGYRWARDGGDRELVADAHSLVLSVAAELGLVGLIALGLLLAGLAKTTWEGVGAANGSGQAIGLAGALGVFAVSIAVDWTWESAALAVLALSSASVLGMAAGTPLRSRPAAPAVPAAWPSSRVRWAMVAAAVILGAIQIPGAVGAASVREAQDQLALGNPEGATASADRALTATPWSGSAYAVRAEARLAGGDPEGAQADADEAIAREPLEAEHRILLARIEAAQGDLPAVVAALSEAVRLSPHERQLGGAEVAAIGRRLERHGYDADDISGS